MSQQTDRLSAALAGRYRIERHLGEGGMASVYLAEDLKHDRKVALKLLKPELAAVLGAERFVQEIKTTASLSHPHILPLFDSGSADGFLFYVMPFIKGETLRDKLNRETQLGVEEAVRIAREIADALDYAHRNGVIHRDIKPENILLHDGRPMVADFGIALALSAAAGGRMTETGLSLGTPHYMSPEQATAEKEISARSDVYSLASVLYEMLAGAPPHVGGSAQQIIMRIITDRARQVTELRASVPPNIAAALAKALEKLPADRFESAKAFADALGNQAFRTTGVLAGTVEPPGARRRTRDPLVLGLAGVTVIALIAAGAALWMPRESEAPARATRVLLTMPPGQEFTTIGSVRQNRHLAISPDGSQIVYRSVGGAVAVNAAQFYRRRLDELESSPIPGTTGAGLPRFSRDGASIALWSDQQRLGVIPSEGGTAVWWSGRSAGAIAGVWGDDGAIYFRNDSSIYRWRPGTADAEPLKARSRRGVTWVLPGSQGALLSGNGEMEALDFATGRSARLGPGAAPKYLSSGHIVFVRTEDGTLMVQPFDVGSLTTTGAAVSTPDRVNFSMFDVADDGTLVYAVASSLGGERLAWVSRTGVITPIEWIDPEVYDAIALSPRGDAILASFTARGTQATGNDIWRFDLAARSRLPLTRDGRSARPRWHPTAPRLLLVRGDSTGPRLWSMPSDGSSQGEPVVELAVGPADGIWAAGGNEILIRMAGAAARNIFRFVPGEHKTPEPVLNTAFQERNPAPSPDGRWLVYTSNRSDQDEVYAQPYPKGGGVVPISLAGGYSPVWSRDGKEVFYVGADGYMWTASVRYDASSFRVEKRTRLFSTEGILIDPHRPLFDVAPDGRFLVRVPPQSNEREPLVLVRNWVQTVTRKN